MIKHILVPTDGSEQSQIGVRYAAAVAAKHGATLHGLYVVDIKLLEGPFLRDISASLGTAPYVNYQGNISYILEERGRLALEGFDRICTEAGVKFDTKQTTGVVSRSILEHSHLADLIILGRAGEHSEWIDGLVGSTTQTVVRRATRPVLVTGTDHPKGERFLIAYDGSEHAKRALQVAAQAAHDWGARLNVLVVGDQDLGEHVDDARNYLSAHDVEAEYTTEPGEPGEVIVQQAGAWNADLLVMGAFGHSKVRELVVGSTTAYALNHAPCPLLLTR